MTVTSDAAAADGASATEPLLIADNVTAGYIPGVHVSLGKVLALLEGLAPKGIVGRIDERILGRALTPDDRRLVREFVSPRAPLIAPEVFEAIARREGFVVPTPRIPKLAYRDLDDID